MIEFMLRGERRCHKRGHTCYTCLGMQMGAELLVSELRRWSGQIRVLERGFHWLGAIMNSPWLHTAFFNWKVCCSAASPSGDFNRKPTTHPYIKCL